MSLDPVALLTAYHAAQEARDFARIEAMLHEHVSYISVGLGEVTGRDHLMESLRSYFAEHPDHHAWDESICWMSAQEAQSVWRLEATDATTGDKIIRKGTEFATFNNEGLLTRIVVNDDGAAALHLP